MNSYRIIKVKQFPKLNISETKSSLVSFTIPGFTEEATTNIRCINLDYHGYEYYEIDHEMLIRDSGLAYGFLNGSPIKLEFEGYKKKFIVNAYLKRTEDFILLSHPSIIVKDLFKKLKNNRKLETCLISYELDLNKAQEIVKDYTGVWFKGVSSRVSSSALFGSDLINEPLFQQLTNEGANLSSIIIPYQTIPLQISENAGISSHVKFENIEKELRLVEKVKEEIIDKIDQ